MEPDEFVFRAWAVMVEEKSYVRGRQPYTDNEWGFWQRRLENAVISCATIVRRSRMSLFLDGIGRIQADFVPGLGGGSDHRWRRLPDDVTLVAAKLLLYA